MKIAIWGSYHHGNYGDDLMALQFAKILEDSGIEPWVYCLDRDLANQFQIRSTDSIDELFNQAKICLIGGGAMLEGGKAKADLDFDELLVTSLHYNCPVFPISVGGDGQGILTQMTPERHSFWTSNICQAPTVRLTSDIALSQFLGKQGTYYPDILWTVGDFWNVAPKSANSEMMHVGINIPNSIGGKLLVHQLNLIAVIKRNITFHFIRTYLPTSTVSNELMPNVRSPYIKHYTYQNPKDTLEFLSTLDLLISHKLHLGLTALALNVPFLSLGGKDKTLSFLREIGAGFAIMPSRKKNIDLVLILASHKHLVDFRNQFDWPRLKRLQELSYGHIQHIKFLAESVAVLS